MLCSPPILLKPSSTSKSFESVVLQVWEDREGRKAMSKTNAKGLTNLRQKQKRYVRDFETEMANFREVRGIPFITHLVNVYG